MKRGRPDDPRKTKLNSFLWHDRSDQSEFIQVIDLLLDIRMLLLVIAVLLVVFS